MTTTNVCAVPKKSRNWCGTLNNPQDMVSDELADMIEKIVSKAKYFVYGLEVGESGTPHWQWYVHFENGIAFSTVVNLFNKKAHVEVCKGSPQQNIDYCLKGEQSHDEWQAVGVRGANYGKNADVHEYGVKPMTQTEKGAASKRKWSESVEIAMSGNMAKGLEEYPSIFVTHWNTLKRLKTELLRVPKRRASLLNFWIHGKSGTGKSRWIDDNVPEDLLYKKMAGTKWWCGYKGEKYVVLDDLDMSTVQNEKDYYTLFKTWTDHYDCPAQTKGGHIDRIRPIYVFVTSQFTIGEVFGFNGEHTEAIQRRFKEIKIEDLLSGAVKIDLSKDESYKGSRDFEEDLPSTIIWEPTTLGVCAQDVDLSPIVLSDDDELIISQFLNE